MSDATWEYKCPCCGRRRESPYQASPNVPALCFNCRAPMIVIAYRAQGAPLQVVMRW